MAVEGLGEGRPSVIVGDIVLVRHSGDRTDTWYEGCVHHITWSSVRLRFNEKFTAYRNAKVDVRFTLNRVPDRRMHQAVVSPSKPVRLLFPSDVHGRGLRRPTVEHMNGISLIDRKLSDNIEQREAISAIVSRPPGSVPFIVFGPYVLSIYTIKVVVTEYGPYLALGLARP